MDYQVGSMEMAYCPMPVDVFNDPQIDLSRDTKIKIYKPYDKIQSIRSEFETLSNLEYTHVINMPGNLSLIIELAKFFKFIYIDCRLPKYIADIGMADFRPKV